MYVCNVVVICVISALFVIMVYDVSVVLQCVVVGYLPILYFHPIILYSITTQLALQSVRMS
jgi:hypothetical protein